MVRYRERLSRGKSEEPAGKAIAERDREPLAVATNVHSHCTMERTDEGLSRERVPDRAHTVASLIVEPHILDHPEDDVRALDVTLTDDEIE